MNILVVVNRREDWRLEVDGVSVVAAQDYVTDPAYSDVANTRVFNLCRSYRYQSLGYYVSLLATARGHKPIPSVTAIQDMKSQAMARLVSDDLDDRIQQCLAHTPSDRLALHVYFGRTPAARYERLTRELFNLFQAPFLRAQFQRNGDGEWTLQSVRPLPAGEIPDAHRDLVTEAARRYFSRGRFRTRRRSPPRCALAILWNPAERDRPSNDRALERFERAAERLGMETERITRDDYARLAEFDALFIRETTSVTHHTYRFARRAEAEGLVVMDDPPSIERCTNKVYLAELLDRHDVPTPRTLIVSSARVKRIIPELGLPVVLKQPDSSFSQGVVKADDEETLRAAVGRLLDRSDLVVAQEFIATPFDWRIGVLDRTPLYACKYYMARRHWQVIDRSGARANSGRSECLRVEDAPPAVVRTALRAANLVGDGFYGVDLKQRGRRCCVIEVNDNPSIDAGVEDAVLKGELYRRVMEVFLERVERRRLGTAR